MRTTALKGITTGLATASLVFVLPLRTCGDAVVTNTNPAALSAAIAGGGTIYLAFSGTVLLSNTLVIATDVALIATNRAVVISGSTNRGAGPLFSVNGGVEFSANGLTLANGRSTNGGAVYNTGKLILNDCVLSNNIAVGSTGAVGIAGSPGTVLGTSGGIGQPGTLAVGGAIYNLGTAVVARCTFVTNLAVGGTGGTGGTGGASNYQGGNGGRGGGAGTGAGGAIYSTGLLQLSNTLFRANVARGGTGGNGGTNGAAPIPGASGEGGPGASAFGGAVFATDGSISACTFHTNSAVGGNSANAAADTRNINGLSGTRGLDAFGGAVFSRGTLEIVNCTFTTNNVTGGKGGHGGNGIPYGGDGGNGGNAWAGNIYSDTNAATAITNCTIVGGAAVGGAAGLKGTGMLAQDGVPGKAKGANLANAGTMVLKNTILAYPTNSVNAQGTIVDGHNNLSSDGTPSSFISSRHFIDPLLLALADNGGGTPTMLPKSTSPAVNGGDCDGVPPVDQRGYPRDGTCDVGAAEVQTSVTPLTSISATNNRLVLSWPAQASQYSLWRAESLHDSAWTPITNAPKINGEVLSIAVPVTSTNKVQFFRLQAQ